MPFEDYLDAMYLMETCRARMNQTFEGCDVLLTPVVDGEAPVGLADTGSAIKASARFGRCSTCLRLRCRFTQARQRPAGGHSTCRTLSGGSSADGDIALDAGRNRRMTNIKRGPIGERVLRLEDAPLLAGRARLPPIGDFLIRCICVWCSPVSPTAISG